MHSVISITKRSKKNYVSNLLLSCQPSTETRLAGWLAFGNSISFNVKFKLSVIVSLIMKFGISH